MRIKKSPYSCDRFKTNGGCPQINNPIMDKAFPDYDELVNDKPKLTPKELSDEVVELCKNCDSFKPKTNIPGDQI